MTIYTDGAHSSKSQIGGWAAIILSNSDPAVPVILSGAEEKTTNNRMEMSALLAALRYLAAEPTAPHTIYTDSAYLFNCFDAKWYARWRRNGWKNMSGEPVKNRDLWEQILNLYEQLEITILKTTAHKDDEYNNLADKTAVKARKALEKEGDK